MSRGVCWTYCSRRCVWSARLESENCPEFPTTFPTGKLYLSDHDNNYISREAHENRIKVEKVKRKTELYVNEEFLLFFATVLFRSKYNNDSIDNIEALILIFSMLLERSPEMSEKLRSSQFS